MNKNNNNTGFERMKKHSGELWDKSVSIAQTTVCGQELSSARDASMLLAKAAHYAASGDTEGAKIAMEAAGRHLK